VAGLLRSLDYAAHAALLELTAERPDDLPVLEPYAFDWEAHARAAFLDGYRAGLGDCAVAPPEAEGFMRLLELFTLEKAVYELRYELDHRPAWLGIPVRGLMRLLGEAAVPDAD
jgi:maltose alpha-D-glucosyltransferase/alpha-amylase